ncbi:hypothetical protein I1H34_23195 [Acaryochloris marina S15]|nr:hypothetical protein I1H34_23195 [Acaryochloris marina S15]
MCIGCYSVPLMALVLPELEDFSGTTVPLRGPSQAMPVQSKLSTSQVRAEIAQITQVLPDSPYIGVLRDAFNAMHQRLERVTSMGEANMIVGEGILNIAKQLETNPNIDRAIKILDPNQAPEAERPADQPGLLEPNAWGWL